MKTISNLWNSNSENDWKDALENYWNYVRTENKKLEQELDNLHLEQIAKLNPQDWYEFLLFKYFKWKYTAPNRYATTTMWLRKYYTQNQFDELFTIKEKLLNLDLSEIKNCLLTANKIKGLGISGASGLLSLMYPEYFSTVDQFVVKALSTIKSLRERDQIINMNPENLNLNNGIFLIKLMRRKAQENNDIFGGNFWTPRKIDMVLWAARE